MTKAKDIMITDVYTLKDIFRAIIPITDMCKVNISERGLNVDVTDIRHIASLRLDMDREFISGYDINSVYILDMKISEVQKMLEDIDDYESAEIFLDTIEIDNNKVHKMKFKVGIINHNLSFEFNKEKEKNEKDKSDIPNNLTEISIGSKDLKIIIKEFYKFSNYILFETRDSKIRVSCTKDNNHDIYAYIGDSITSNIKGIFDLKYLNDFIDAINLNGHWNDNIVLFMGSDLPMKIKFNVGRYGLGIYTLAPLV